MAITLQSGHILETSYYVKIKQFCTDYLPNIGMYNIIFDEIAESRNYCFAIAVNDNDDVVGVSLNQPANVQTYLAGHTELQSYLSNNNISIDDCVYAAGVFIHPDYRGDNLLDALTIEKTNHSLSDGYTHTILFGYGSDLVYDYNIRIGYYIQTGCTDYEGREIMLRQLSDYEAALAPN